MENRPVTRVALDAVAAQASQQPCRRMPALVWEEERGGPGE